MDTSRWRAGARRRHRERHVVEDGRELSASCAAMRRPPPPQVADALLGLEEVKFQGPAERPPSARRATSSARASSGRQQFADVSMSSALS